MQKVILAGGCCGKTFLAERDRRFVDIELSTGTPGHTEVSRALLLNAAEHDTFSGRTLLMSLSTFKNLLFTEGGVRLTSCSRCG